MIYSVKSINGEHRVGQYIIGSSIQEIDIDTISFFFLIVLQRLIATNSVVAINEDEMEDNSKTYQLSIAIAAKFN